MDGKWIRTIAHLSVIAVSRTRHCSSK